MMRYQNKNFSIGNSRFELTNAHIDKRDGFNHRTKLFHNGNFVIETETHYINRTWERYQFQTSMKVTIKKAMEQLENSYIRIFKEQNNIKRLTAKRRIEAMEQLENKSIYKDLLELSRQI